MTRTTSTPLYLGQELRRQAEKAASARGLSLSAWVREAIANQLETDQGLADGLAALAEWDAVDGPVPADVLDHVHRELDDAGLLPQRRSA